LGVVSFYFLYFGSVILNSEKQPSDNREIRAIFMHIPYASFPSLFEKKNDKRNCL